MKRIDLIYQELLQYHQVNGATANILAEKLNLSRANVSSDLNRLVDQGTARKITGKPVIYHPIIKINALEKFARQNPSLKMLIRQAQAAVLYPPKGLNMLFYGETGVGKSMFARIIAEYAQHAKKNTKDAPFIHFNCADYASNPQLLLGQLFGVSKNAYTGADQERKGLIAEAHGGILFLDEIHRLPPEGQEMFFTFIDRGVYHRLGEAEIERTASVQLISATTEAPQSTLLQTFQRRIPMVLEIPNLAERSIQERGNLVSLFFQEEANRLNEPLTVSQNAIRAFVSYHCPNNIGQLKNDIQLACAKAYADFMVTGQKKIAIYSPDLPPNVLNGLYNNQLERDAWTKLQQYSKRYIRFLPKKDTLEAIPTKEPSIYELLQANSVEHPNQLNYDDLIQIIEDNFASLEKSNNTELSLTTIENDYQKLKSFITEPLFDICIETIRLAEKLLSRKLDPKMENALAIHIFTTYNRIRRGERLKKHPDFWMLKNNHGPYMDIANECLIFLNAALDIFIPEEEAAFLAMFFLYNNEKQVFYTQHVRVIVITHGNSGATSMVSFVNSLLETQIAIGINMPIEESSAAIVPRLKKYLIEKNVTEDLLFLVDMGSLTTIGRDIEQELGNHCRTIALCSTLHVLEATRKAILGYTLNEVYRDTLQVNHYYQSVPENPHTDKIFEEKPAVILTFCLTGEGTAIVMKKILEKKLTLTPDHIQIMPVTILQDESIHHYLEHLKKNYQILCIVSSVPLDTAFLQFELYDLFQQETLNQIQKLVDIDLTYKEIPLTLAGELLYIDSYKVVPDIKKMITQIETQLGYHLHIKITISLIFHLSCLIDQLHGDRAFNSFPDKAEFISLHQKDYLILLPLITELASKYSVIIPEDEVCYILSIFTVTDW